MSPITNNITKRLHLTGQTFNVTRQNRNVKTFRTPVQQLTTHNRVMISGFQVRFVQYTQLVQQNSNIMKYFQVSLMRCKWQIENSTWRIVPKILCSPNRTNRSNRQAYARVPEYREIFVSVANEMQMADRKLYLADRPKNSLFAK